MCFVQILNNKHKILYFLWLHQLHTENYAIGHILSWMSRQTTILVPLLESLCWLINGAANNRSLVCLVTIVPSSWHAKKEDDHHWGCFTSLIWLTTKDRSNNLHKATTYVYAKIVAKSVPEYNEGSEYGRYRCESTAQADVVCCDGPLIITIVLLS